MCRKTHTATLTPAGLAVDGVEIGAAKIIVMARPSTKMATCPECGAVSGRIHSRYRRRLIDLPAHGRIVEMNVETRRFRCGRAAGGALLSSASVTRSHRRQPAERWTDGIVHRLELALGGRPGHNLASRLANPVSKDTLLGTVRRRAAIPSARSALTTGPGARDANTAPLSVISSAAASLHSCRIARVAPVPPGCAITPASSSLPGIVARATAAPHPRVRPRPYKSPIVGTSSKTPARAFLMSCARTCTPSANRRPLTTSTPRYSVVLSASGGRIFNTARRRSTRCCGCSNRELHSNRLPAGSALHARRFDVLLEARPGGLSQPREHPRAVRRDARRALDGRLPEWRRTLAPTADTGIPGIRSGRRRMGHPPPPR